MMNCQHLPHDMISAIEIELIIFISPFHTIGPAPLNVAEYERYAKDTLSRNAHGYYASGSNDMITLRENREAYSRLRLMPKILVDVSSISTG
jgi:FMN-dependent dehydrogenase